jgi:hypothetical protein
MYMHAQPQRVDNMNTAVDSQAHMDGCSSRRAHTEYARRIALLAAADPDERAWLQRRKRKLEREKEMNFDTCQTLTA